MLKRRIHRTTTEYEGFEIGTALFDEEGFKIVDVCARRSYS